MVAHKILVTHLDLGFPILVLVRVEGLNFRLGFVKCVSLVVVGEGNILPN